MLKISIIMAVFNNESTVEEAIKSVINQDYKNIELIVIDGNSTDKTVQVVNKHRERLQLISEDDNGIYDAMNKGIALATGDVLGILNSDDFLADNNVITRIVKAFLTDEKIEAVISNVTFVDKLNTAKELRYYSSKFFKPWMFRFGFQPAHPTFYARRTLFKKFGSYRTDLSISADFELLLRFIKLHHIVYKYIDDVWVKMRVGGVSTSGIKSILKLNSEIIRAHEINSLYTNSFFVYSKYLIKWWGFVKK